MDDRDEFLTFLPKVLRGSRLTKLLLPPPHIVAIDRGLYPIRMTLAIVGLIQLSVHGAFFIVFNQRLLAGVAVLSFALIICAIAVMWRGAGKLGLLIGWLVVFGYMVVLHLMLGVETGILLFAFPVAGAAFSVYRPNEWAWRLVPTGLAVAAWAALLAHFDFAPHVRLTEWEKHLLLVVHAGQALYAVFVLASHAAVFRDAAEARIAAERDRADRLLLNILPAPIAARLKAEPGLIADSFGEATVLFADLVGFTALSSRLSSREIVEILNRLFSDFDALAEKHGIEKIKTIGDAYMVVGGVPNPADDHGLRCVRMAIDMLREVDRYSAESGRELSLRIGIHTGPVTAGVIGQRKFSYDLWGDTVNVASRMESHGEPGRIHVSGVVRDRVGGVVALTGRREIEVKGKGLMETWFVA